MAILLDTLAILVGGVLTFALFPYAFRWAGKTMGNSVRSRTQQRRELLLSRAASEEKAESEQKAEGKPASSSASSEEGDWEKVHPNEPTPAAQSTPPTGNDFTGVIAFFHPFCNAGGGGERVLFAAIHATQLRYPRALCCVYTGDHDASKAAILSNCSNRFNIHLNAPRVCFLYLSTREYVLPSKYPHFTLLGQSLGSLLLGWEAWNLLVPDIVVDTMGYAFTLWLSKWLFPDVPTGAYVHYPTISTDMLDTLSSTTASGKGGIHAGLGVGLRGRAKSLYWHLFARVYGWVGSSIDVVMTNSSWTQRHISTIWGPARRKSKKGSRHAIEVVYPPCAVEELQKNIPLDQSSSAKRTNDILYIAQFRPEKMHTLVIDAFAAFLSSYPDLAALKPPPQLILVGSVRDDGDEKRVYKLRLQAQSIKDKVHFVVNAKWPQILEWLGSSSVGVNGMWNEHFGIGVVEYQAAGLISVVNDSGGPKEDIVVDVDGLPTGLFFPLTQVTLLVLTRNTGFLATTPDDFAEGFAKALELGTNLAFAMRERARKSSWRFSEQVFSEAWIKQLERLVLLAGTS